MVHRKDIDDARWNNVISASRFETIYPYTWYLDASADEWFGLIMQDYECIMPVAFRKKYSIKYIYQPYHTQQLGIFSEKPVDIEVVRLFLNRIIKDYKLGAYAFNTGNLLKEEPGFELDDSTNYVLPLINEYDQIYLNYSENTRRNVRKSCLFDLSITDKMSVNEFVELKQASAPGDKRIFFFQNMQRLLLELERLGKIRIYGVFCGKEICAAAVFATSEKRLIYLLSASLELGKDQRAMFHLVDSMIRMHAGEDILLDFEGSNSPTIARFFGGFGAKPEIYQRIEFNKLPFRRTRKKKNV